ncbi:MAG: large conductance mechanosensitive channel protein MscL [Clostridia bacterium]|nr:large conductance mechanosensitive channel protein MscL [Clostridia bacterium]
MKKFFGEFKKFIMRGNVMDMAVGVIVGSSFTAIVNAMSNNILKPIINWILALIFGANSLSDLYTFLKRATTLDDSGAEVLDLANSIYIDWGAFINAIINFLLVALVLFTIVKLFNSLRDKQKALTVELLTGGISKEDRAAMKAAGISRRDKTAVSAFLKAKAAREAEEKAKADAEAKEKARLEREANPTAEDLLKRILSVLESK